MAIDLTEAYVVDKDGITLGESGVTLLSGDDNPNTLTIDNLIDGTIYLQTNRKSYVYRDGDWYQRGRWHRIVSDENVLIEEYMQVHVIGELKLEGCLRIDGQLVVG